jgi:hypothetical protein
MYKLLFTEPHRAEDEAVRLGEPAEMMPLAPSSVMRA